MEGKSCCNHGPAWVVKIKLPAQVDAPTPVLADRVVVFVAKSVGTNRKMFAFPADSPRVSVHPKEIERKPVSAVAVEPKDTIEVVLEPQTAGERLFKPYNLFASPIAYRNSRTVIVGVKVVREPFRAVLEYILPVVEATVPRLP